ncbi:MAG TPA: DUF2520 domain-containing protein [Gemmatimonadaceae bacterium]|nr:DUF2520 domain-containing protein [Gemmatimonadaceae bacterium]
MSERIFIQGAGRAGLGLARALRASGADVAGVHGRHNPGGLDGVTTGALPAALREAGVVLVAVRDAQIDEAVAELVAAGLMPGAVVLHLSGSAQPESFGTLRERGNPCGTFHPLLPLADPSRAPALFRGAWIGIDGDAGARRTACALAARLGAHTLEIPAGEKARYHAAAVMASNFPVVLLALAERLLRSTGVDAETAHSALRPLFHAAAENVGAQGAARALTGPVVRGDAQTVRAHLDALRSDAEMADVYRALARAAVDVARGAGADDEKLREILALVR